MIQDTQDLVPNWLTATPDPNVAIGEACAPFKVEMVIRGYMAGHAAREYKAGKRMLCGVEMPQGLKENDAFASPIITPATKAEMGAHDEDISREDILARGIVSEEDYLVLEELIRTCIKKGLGEIGSIYNNENKLVASGFFLKHKKSVTILVSSTDFNNRKNGENTFLIDRAIYKYQKKYEVFNFGGSSMKQIASYFLSFGAKTVAYDQIKYNNLSYIIKLFKR